MGGAPSVLVVLGVLVAAWLAAAALFARTRGRPAKSPESRLLRVCRGDAARADRLIDGELSRAPGSSRSEAAARAIEKVRRDNR